MIKYREIISRIKKYKITGISTAVFGISWEIKDSDRKIVSKLISYFEDRRVLYLQYEPHMKKANCIESVLNIREYLTNEITQITPDSELIPILKYLRASCRKFLLRIEPFQNELDNLPEDVPSNAKFVFSTALGELRASFGDTIAMLCTKYKINVSNDLGLILPIEDIEYLPNNIKYSWNKRH
jgi:hypothetical protein